MKIRFADQRAVSSLISFEMLEQQCKCTWTVEGSGITAYGGDNEGTASISSYRWNVRISGCKDLRHNEREWNNSVTLKIVVIWVAGTWQ